MAKRKYTIHRSTVTHKWRIICHKFGRCALIPRAASHQEAVHLMDNHEWVWHTDKKKQIRRINGTYVS